MTDDVETAANEAARQISFFRSNDGFRDCAPGSEWLGLGRNPDSGAEPEHSS